MRRFLSTPLHQTLAGLAGSALNPNPDTTYMRMHLPCTPPDCSPSPGAAAARCPLRWHWQGPARALGGWVDRCAGAPPAPLPPLQGLPAGGRQADRQADRQAGRQACRQAGMQTGRQADRQADRRANSKGGRQRRRQRQPAALSRSPRQGSSWQSCSGMQRPPSCLAV
jgi:hypothetical protein